MTASAALAYTYAYGRPSALFEDERRKRLFLATSEGGPSPVLFEGRLLAPRRTADLLSTLSAVVGSRFYVPPSMLEKILRLADPVITSSGDRLRFEGFSGCCGAYARLDLLPAALDGRFLGKGTSNVDFGPSMRAALGRIADADDVALSLAADAFAVKRDGEVAIERKVDLPVRWLRGFGEVQAYQARMEPRFELTGPAFRRFLRELPATWKGPAHVAFANGSLRIGERGGETAIRVGGLTRLRILRGAAPHAERVRVFDAGNSGASAWEITTPDSRFVYVLSPDVSRGFSGEGQHLAALTSASNGAAMTATRAALHWQNAIDAARIARDAGVAVRDVEAALAECAVAGIAGYDLAEGAYFHRVLPFDVPSGHKRQPRLQSAKKLASETPIEIARDGERVQAWVPSGDVEYRVAIEGEAWRCTCPWYAKHRNERGPCKHVLAVRLALNERRVVV